MLVVSDRVDPELQGPELEARVSLVDAVVSCGDLPFSYLEYLVTFLSVPLFYVRGNHDPPEDSGKLPRGCVALDGQVREFGGVYLAGLSGCRWYSGGPNQYTERQMRRRGRSLSAKMSCRALFRGKRPVVFVSHAAPLGMGDGEDLCHRGFGVFGDLILRHSPLVWLHGHVHPYGANQGDSTHDSADGLEFASTRVINTYGYRVISLQVV